MTWKKIVIWDFISIALIIGLLTLDDFNSHEWNIYWLYPVIRVPMVLTLFVFAFMSVITVIYIINHYDE